jgi:DNA-binding response OmpR family regulator
MTVPDSRAVREAAARYRPHLVVLAGVGPVLELGELVGWLRARGDVGVIFLTGPDSDEVCAGFEAGGDDCIVKPFRAKELSLRVHAVLRRTVPDASHEWRVGDLLVDEGARAVYRANEEIRLGRTEFRLLVTLVRHRNRVVTRSQLATEAWGYPDPSGNLLDAHISLLRRKLGAAGHERIVTLRGEGYMLRSPAPAEGREVS